MCLKFKFKIMEIKVCCWTSCKKRHSKYIIKRIKNDIKFFNLENVEVKESLCMWMCSKWPNVKIDNEVFNNSNPIKISNIMLKKLWIKKNK